MKRSASTEKKVSPWQWLIRLAFLAMALFIIVRKSEDAPDNWEMWHAWQWLSLIALSILGLVLEALMWWLPAKRLSQLTFSAAFRNTLTFQYFHLFAPSGLSEFGARYIQFPKGELRRLSVEITALIQAAKWISRMILAAIGLLYFKHPLIHPHWLTALSIVLGATSFIAIMLIRRPRYWRNWLKDHWDERIARWLPQIAAGKFPIYAISLISLCKTLTYTLAFALLISNGAQTTGAEIWNNLAASWTFYFGSSFLPSLGMVEGIVKAGAGMIYFDHWTISEYRIGASIFLIWMFNKATPGLIGGLSTLFKKSQTEANPEH